MLESQVLQSDLVSSYIQILDVYHSFNIINLSVTYRVNRVWFLNNFFPDPFPAFIKVKPNDIASVRHQRSDVPVSQMKDAFNDFLLSFFNRSLLSPFTDNGFDLVFRDVALFRRFNRKYPEESIARIVEQRDNRITNP
jgi:hypothetical protein